MSLDCRRNQALLVLLRRILIRFDRRLLRILLMLMVVLMPVRMVWGAAATYCAHEADTVPTHWGHHFCSSSHMSASDESGGDKKAGLGDPDCSACHAWVAHIKPVEVSGVADGRGAFTAPPLQLALPSCLLPDI